VPPDAIQAQGAAIPGSNELDMLESAPALDRQLTKAIGTLSSEFPIPVQDIAEIYRAEFDRLAQVARIPTYLGVLAMRNTRLILRGGATQAPLR
jgi:hypothetical protein